MRPPAFDDAPEPDEVPADEQIGTPPAAPEESPLDFPEEKPDGDRLWFEQKPRRDFDFDD
jgi:hypothetical protein